MKGSKFSMRVYLELDWKGNYMRKARLILSNLYYMFISSSTRSRGENFPAYVRKHKTRIRNYLISILALSSFFSYVFGMFFSWLFSNLTSDIGLKREKTKDKLVLKSWPFRNHLNTSNYKHTSLNTRTLNPIQ